MKEPLTEDHARTLHETLRGHPFEAIITLALVTGMRRDELLALSWQTIDLEQRTIHVSSTKQPGYVRTIPLWANMTERLTVLRDRQRAACAQAGTPWQHTDRVFTEPGGEPLTVPRLLHIWRDLCQQAGLPPLRFHEMRLAVWRKRREQQRATKEEEQTQ